MNLLAIQNHLAKQGSKTTAQDYVLGVLSLGPRKKGEMLPGMKGIAGKVLDTGDTVTQKGWEATTDFLEHVGIVEKINRRGTFLRVGRSEALRILAAEAHNSAYEMRCLLIKTWLDHEGEVPPEKLRIFLEAPPETILKWYGLREYFYQLEEASQKSVEEVPPAQATRPAPPP